MCEYFTPLVEQFEEGKEFNSVKILVKLVNKVRAMRTQQKKYFKTHDREALINAKSLEKDMDQLIEDILNFNPHLFTK